MTITLLGDKIEAADDFVEVEKLRFLKDNPRVYACTHGEENFELLTAEEQRDRIFEKLLLEPSVKNLEPEIRRHGGLIEPILIRQDRMEVIEGNSRLAVYRKLRDNNADGEWDLIPCIIISSLTDDQQFAFLNQVHVKGKTQWSAYEKANFAYVRKAQGWEVDRIAELFGEHVNTIRTRIRSIELMRDNQDTELLHFSHYDVLVRGQGVLKSLDERPELKTRVMEDLRKIPPPEQRDHVPRSVTAQELRRLFSGIVEQETGLKPLCEGYNRIK